MWSAQMNALNVQLELHERLEFLVINRDTWTITNGFVTLTM